MVTSGPTAQYPTNTMGYADGVSVKQTLTENKWGWIVSPMKLPPELFSRMRSSGRVTLSPSEYADVVDEESEVETSECTLITLPICDAPVENPLQKRPNIVVPELNKGAVEAIHGRRRANNGCHEREWIIDLLLLSDFEQCFKIAFATLRIASGNEQFHKMMADRNLFVIFKGGQKVRLQCAQG